MNGFKNSNLKSMFAVALLFVMAFKMCAFIIYHSSNGNDTFSIEKNAEEGKDAKEESFNKNDTKLLFSGHYTIDHIHYSWINHVKPVCRYRLQEITDPLLTVPTPPPNFSA